MFARGVQDYSEGLVQDPGMRPFQASRRIDTLDDMTNSAIPRAKRKVSKYQKAFGKNLVISQIAKNKFKVRRTIAKTNDPQNLKVFYSLGVDVPIDTTTILTKIIEEEASYQDFISLLSFKKGRLALVKVNISPGAPSANKKIKDLRLPRDTVLLAILRQENVVIPRGDTSLLVNDEVVALTRITLEKEVLRALIGKV